VRLALSACVLLAGCDYVLGLERDVPDAAAPDVPEPNPCTRPAFDTYKFAQRPKWGMSPEVLLHPTVNATNTVYFQTVGGRVYSADVDSATGANSLALESGFVRFHPSLSHDWTSLFFQRRTFPDYVITDVMRWKLDQDITTRTPVTFTVNGTAMVVDPGNSAFYRGVHRMVVWITTSGGDYRLVEVESTDLDNWIQVPANTLPWALPAGEELDSNLSADGCVLVFISNRTGSYDVWYAWRRDDGIFGDPERLEFSDPNLYERGITYAPDGRLWFLRGIGVPQGNQELYVGTPP
jgi:hypothetical protein